MSIEVPVVFIIFRRPETTRRVFAEIARAQPKQLFIIADGGRTPEEQIICEETRKIVIDNIDWDCEVETNFSDHNLGLRARIASGLDWVFSKVERAIILEDDCLPHPTFFHFCEELLEYYANEPRVMHISGDYFLDTCVDNYDASYYFTRYAHVWGWATWRRAWANYDTEFEGWREPQKTNFLQMFKSANERAFWKNHLNAVSSGQINTWDSIWAFVCIAQNGLCINPTSNLVSNIGFGITGTHTLNKDNKLADLPTSPMKFPLIHPASLERSTNLDEATAKIFFRQRHLLLRVLSKLYRVWKVVRRAYD